MTRQNHGPAQLGLAMPSGRGFIALLEAFRATGGTAPGEVVGRLLDAHDAGNPTSLAKLIATGQVFGFAWRACLWIPMFQFDAHDLRLKAGAQRIRAQLPVLWSDWTVASWFAQASVRLEGRSPADALDADLEAVMRAARSPLQEEDVALPVAAGRRPQQLGAHV